MALQIALGIKEELAAMGLTCTIYGDDWNRHYVRVDLTGHRFDSLHEFKQWQREWFDVRITVRVVVPV